MKNTSQKRFNSSYSRILLVAFALMWTTILATAQGDIYNIKVNVDEGNDSLIFFADNHEILPMTLRLKFETEGLTPSEYNQELVILKPQSSNNKIAIFKAEPNKGYGYSYSYQIIKGDINAKHNDDYAYRLPYEKGLRTLLAQGYNGPYSHQGLKALDFNLPEQTNVLAARSGLVIETKEDSNIGCTNMSCIKLANYVYILHDDGTIGQYAHLAFGGVLVGKGDRVERGQLIAKSGKTGFASGPHLHFQVTLPSLENGKAIATKFQISKNEVAFLKEKTYYTSFEN